MIISRINTINFKSNAHREAEMRELARLKELRRQYLEQKLINRMSYPELDDPMSTKMAGFLSKFTCAIQNASEHNIMEFFWRQRNRKRIKEKSFTGVSG